LAGLVDLSCLDHAVMSLTSAAFSSPPSSSSSDDRVPLAKLVLSLDGRTAKLQALRHLLTTLHIFYARYIPVFSNCYSLTMEPCYLQHIAGDPSGRVLSFMCTVTPVVVSHCSCYGTIIFVYQHFRFIVVVLCFF